MNYIRWFDEIGTAEVGLVGGKGANLGELTRAGLPVPPGFCITSGAYELFLQATGGDWLINDLLSDLDHEDLDEIETRSAQIQKQVQSHPIPFVVANEIASAYTRLQQDLAGPVKAGAAQDQPHEIALAVRSSATAEDQANASFAGQLETYLNIRGLPSLLEYVKQCWASLWSTRVISYIVNQGLQNHAVSICVVVQSMVPSEISGVFFTANPVNGRQDEVVINASWGLGEAIVSGIVSPDTITARKRDGQVISRQTAVKELMVAYAADGGTCEVKVPEAMRSAPALTDGQVKELTVLGQKIEAYYGKPQDIEWGFYQGQCYLLQSRPITTLARRNRAQIPEGEFNRTMFIEIFPDPLSPVFLSVIGPMFKEMLDFTFRSLGFQPPKDIQAIGEFYNQPYFNRNYISGAFQPLSPGIREPLIAQVVNPFGSEQGKATVEFSWPFLKMAIHILDFMVRFPRQLPGLLATYRAEISQAEAFSYTSASDAEIVALIHRIPFEYANKLLNNDFLMIAVIGRTYHLLGALLEKYYGEDTDEIVAKLISGVTGNVTMETNKRLWDLAQTAKSSGFVNSVLRQNTPDQAAKILQQSKDGREFCQVVDRFLREYGHREVHMDILYPTWKDDPEPVFSFVRSYLDADESQSPHRQQERLIEERERLTRNVLKDVKKGLMGRLVLAPVFSWVLHQTQLHTRERDTMHFEMTRLFPPIRRLMLELGRRWQAAGLLENVQDIFYLKLEEMKAMAQAPHPMQEAVQNRRDEFVRNQHSAWPDIISNGEEIYAGSVEEIEGATSLQGVAGSPGKAVGVSRVIQGPEEFGKLQKGEILVSPITNPVWTPLFAIAGGIITEVGGILSHGAIVAREYGIPAVMSVPGATRRLKDGQRVRLDGNKGIVYLE